MERVSALDSNAHMGERDERAQIIQNIADILATPQGSVPMYRDFGIPAEALDLPLPAAEARLRAAVKEAVERWEPRAEIRSVQFEHLDRGQLRPVVEVEIHAES